jgi:hypothetical protein
MRSLKVPESPTADLKGHSSCARPGSRDAAPEGEPESSGVTLPLVTEACQEGQAVGTSLGQRRPVGSGRTCRMGSPLFSRLFAPSR